MGWARAASRRTGEDSEGLLTRTQDPARSEVPGLPQQAQTGEEVRNNWYAAHLILYVKLKNAPQRSYPVWENIVLVKAGTVEEAYAKAEAPGKAEEGDDDGTFRWGGKPARWVFAGVRKLTLCEDAEKRSSGGTEVSYSEMEVDSEQAFQKLVHGQAVSVKYRKECVESDS